MKNLTASILSKIAIAFVVLANLGCGSPASPKKIPLAPKKKASNKFLGEITVSVDPKIDVLFVIDDSGSMSIHQKNISANIKNFTKSFTRNTLLDYNIGVTSTDIYTRVGELRTKNGNPTIITARTPDNLRKLEENLILGTVGGGTEAVFQPTIAALSDPVASGPNKGFSRKDAFLVLIFVTDAGDQSQPSISAQQMNQFLIKHKGGQEDFVAYGAIIPATVSDADCSRSGEPKQDSIEAFINMTGGKYFSLCDPDFGRRLAEIGDDVAQRIEVFVPLEEVPLVETIKVMYGTQRIKNDPDTGWSYDPNRVGLYFGKNLKLSKQKYGTKPTVKYVRARKDKEKYRE